MRTAAALFVTLVSVGQFAYASAGETPKMDPALEAPAKAPSAAAKPDADSPMLGFSRLIGGSWKIGPFRHEFAWGIGKSTVIARTYDAEGKLSAEARWFWHPGAQAIKGYSIDATGASFAEMTTSFEGDVLINELTTVTPEGAKKSYTGKWNFTTKDSYDWTLYNQTDEGLTKAMSMTANRVAK